MRPRRWIRLVALVAALGLLAAGCGDDDDDTTTTEPGNEGGGGLKIGMVFDVGGKGDKSFNDSAFAGLTRAAEELDADIKELEPNADGSNRGELMRSLADDGYELIIGVGFAFAEDMGAIAPEYPDTSFAIIDGVVEADNVTSLLFAEEQGSFLVGAAAALKSETGKIGFVGGVEGDLIKKFQAGFEAGAKAANPDIEIDSKYIAPDGDFSGFDDAAQGKTIAAGQYEAGADVVYHAAGKSGLGVFEAAVEADALAIGVDSDQYLTATPEQQPHILTSMLKRVDNAVFDAIEAFSKGELEATITTGDLSTDSVGYSTEGGQLDDIVDQLEEFKQQIIDGDIEVPTTP